MIRNEERSGLVFTIAGGAILLVVLLGLLGFFHAPGRAPVGAAHATPRRLGSVAGEIVDALTGRAVAETNLDVRGLDGVSDHWREPPDPERPHRFELKGLPADRDFTLEISAAGHVTERRDTRVSAGGTTDLGEIRLVPLVALTGTVVDANGQPVADAELAFTRETPDGTDANAPPATTQRGDAHGAFRADGLDPGVWNVAARTTAGERCDAPVRVDAHGGGEAAPIEIEVFPTWALHGRLKLPIGAPAPDEVRWCERSAAVAGDGSFTCSGLFAGARRLFFRFGGQWRQSISVGIPDDALEIDAQQLIDVPGPERERYLAGGGQGDAERGGPCSLVVRIVDEAGRPLSGALVQLVVRGRGFVRRLTARNGETTFRGLTAGSAAGVGALHGKRRSFDPLDVTITERSSATPCELRCLPIHKLVVKVVTAGGAPVARVRVGAGVGIHDFRETDAAGCATFAEMPPPPWPIEVKESDGFEAWSSDAAQPGAGDTVTIELKSRDAAKRDAKNGQK